MQKKDNRVAVVIVAAGRGERAGGNGPKQYQILNGKPLLAHTLQPFLEHESIDNVTVVIHSEDAALYYQLIPEHQKLLSPTLGGSTRQRSVLNGLSALEGKFPQQVLIHDAARPFVDADLIDRVINGYQKDQGVLPVVAVADTLKRRDEPGYVTDTISRDGIFAAHTPQAFDYSIILMAHRAAYGKEMDQFTDDSALAEWAGIPVKLVESSPHNTKITTKADMEAARAKMEKTIADVRVGHGYDTHQLIDGSSIWLCGAEIPHDKSLMGHSDADVGLHALTDAILATIAAGDIGSHFPPSDDKWKDAKSDQFLKHAVELVEKAGGRITHMDVTLVCEEPKIGPHRDFMRATISKITRVDVSRISIKATTNERIGFVGREEGMVAIATATVVMGTT